jgi:hypothetical protein
MMSIKRRVAIVLGAFLFGVIAGVVTAAAQDKGRGVSSGKVTAVSQSELAITSGERSLKFVVNGETDVLAKAPSKATK